MENRSVFFGVAGLGAIAAIVASLAPRVVTVPQPAAARAAAADSAELRASARHSDPLCGPGLSQGARAAGRLPRTSTLRRTLGVRTRCGDPHAAGPGRVPPRLGVRLRARSDPPRLRAVVVRHRSVLAATAGGADRGIAAITRDPRPGTRSLSRRVPLPESGPRNRRAPHLVRRGRGTHERDPQGSPLGCAPGAGCAIRGADVSRLRHPGAHRAPARAVVFGIVPLAPARPAAVALARRSRGGFGAHGEWVGNEPRQAHDAYFRPRAVRGDPFQFRRPRPTLAL